MPTINITDKDAELLKAVVEVMKAEVHGRDYSSIDVPHLPTSADRLGESRGQGWHENVQVRS